jgi:3',5'-cyclic AMP phosphodiesterase CpdA
MYVLAHLSDPHLGPLPRATAIELSGKRAFGFLNWHRGRKAMHRTDVLDILLHDLKAQTPAHIAVTGDLVNLALPAEFLPARKWLNRVGSPEHVSFVPGNHDLYVRTAMHEPQSHWGDYMKGDQPGETAFPYLRHRGPLALIGLSTAIPTPPLMATGALGSAQLARLEGLLTALSAENVFRVVLLHHPPVGSRGDRFKRLIDSAALRALLKKHGAELVLHGHDHVHSVKFIDGPQGPIPAVGVPSASALGHEGDPAAYHLFEIEGCKGAWCCEAVTRGFRRGQTTIGEIARRALLGA